MQLKEGDQAPDFEISDEQGHSVHLSDFRGKKVVLYFYPKDNTSGCTAQACNLRDNHELLTQSGHVVLGISSDTSASHQKFIDQYQLPFKLLADVDKKVHELYGTWVEKSMYGRTYMGTNRMTFVIDEHGIISRIIAKVKTKEHTQQIV